MQPLFVTVDPERDTAEHLAEYVPLFHPRLIGLTGSLDAIRRAADAYKVYFAKVPIGKEAGDYTVDHTAFIYLMDRDGNYLGFFPPGTTADRMAEIIRPRLAEPARSCRKIARRRGRSGDVSPKARRSGSSRICHRTITLSISALQRLP